jgi:demethylmenaquinone methyltransferase/2-methoxy-6-polyprenyl-1,4-benzoquinol methylase
MMSDLNGKERAQYVQSMFTQIAPRYDLMNRLMTGGQDVFWRREVIRRTALPPDGKLLDLGAGTGDLAREALRQRPHVDAVAADFTLEMMRIGRQRMQERATSAIVRSWAAADALHLPFVSDYFDAVVSGYLMRNVIDLRASLLEQWRVLKPGGWLVALDTTRPKRSLLTPFINFHLHTVIPRLGDLLTGQAEAYTYLPETTQNFLHAEQLAERLTATGFQQVGFRRYMFGTMAIHWGKK